MEAGFVMGQDTGSRDGKPLHMAFGEKGSPPVHLGGVGLFGMLGNIVGVLAALGCFNERDIYKWVAYSGMGINMLGMILWTVTIFWGI